MPFPYLRQYKFPKGLTAIKFLKLAWKEQAPVTMCVITIIGSAAYMLYAVNSYTDLGPDVKRYKLHYTVLRHDDPKVQRIKE